MKITELLENNADYIIEKYISGVSTSKLGQEFGCNAGMIWNLLKNRGVEIRKRKNYGAGKDNKELIIKMYQDGESCYKISKAIGIRPPSLIKYMNSIGLDTSKYNKNYHEIKLKDISDKIINMYNQGLGTTTIAKTLGYSQSKVWELLQHNNVAIRPLSNYQVDETFFDILDSEIKCYVFGLWLADGCVDNKGKLRLQMADLEIIKEIKCVMKYSGPIYRLLPRKDHHKTQYCLCINRKRLADKLIEKGCPPNKSLILDFPTDFAPEHLNAVVRGYFDGDGSISTKLTYAGIVGTESFCLSLGKILESMDIKFQIYERWKNKKSSTRQLFISKEDDKYRFLKWIYDGANIYLERKYELYRQLILKRIANETWL